MPYSLLVTQLQLEIKEKDDKTDLNLQVNL